MRKAYTILLIFLAATLCAALLTGCLPNRSREMPDGLVGGAEANPVRPIYKEVERTFGFEGVIGEYAQQQHLLDGVMGNLYDGERARPDLECPHLLPRVRETYQNAIGILNYYITNDMTAVERVRVIYAYLVSRVRYDFLLFDYNLSGGRIDTRHDSFTLIGVFVNSRAVCQGISRAVDLMCAIEGIESTEVLGSFWDLRHNIWVTHTWNKINIGGANSDRWYNVDATAGAVTAFINGREITLFSHAYLLVSDYSITNNEFGRHSFTHTPGSPQNPPTPDGDYDLRALIPQIFIDSLDELLAFFDTVARSRRRLGRFELRLNFAHTSADTDAAFARVRDREISRYYRKINNHYIFLVYT